jgi:hypothetical protein
MILRRKNNSEVEVLAMMTKESGLLGCDMYSGRNI